MMSCEISRCLGRLATVRWTVYIAHLTSFSQKMVYENQRNWCELTPYVTFAYNTSYHSSTTFSPFYLL